jgi:hypothetical protein
MKPEPAKQTTYTTLEPVKISAPTIKLSKLAIKWLTVMADVHNHEIGVFGFVDELPNNTYLIRDIFYPKHSEAAGATCEISPEGETLMAEWLISHNRENDIAKAKFWGHSHVNMGVFPSGQDEDQSIERMNRNQSYLIRGIFNKDGLLSISFYDYQNKRRFDNIKWETDEDEEEQKIREKILELKTINLPVVTPVRTYGGTAFSDEYDESSFNQRRGFGFSTHEQFTGKTSRALVIGDPNNDRFFTQNFNRKKNKKNKHKHSYVYEFEKK